MTARYQGPRQSSVRTASPIVCRRGAPVSDHPYPPRSHDLRQIVDLGNRGARELGGNANPTMSPLRSRKSRTRSGSGEQVRQPGNGPETRSTERRWRRRRVSKTRSLVRSQHHLAARDLGSILPRSIRTSSRASRSTEIATVVSWQAEHASDQPALVRFGLWQNEQVGPSLRCPAWKLGVTPSAPWQFLHLALSKMARRPV